LIGREEASCFSRSVSSRTVRDQMASALQDHPLLDLGDVQSYTVSHHPNNVSKVTPSNPPRKQPRRQILRCLSFPSTPCDHLQKHSELRPNVDWRVGRLQLAPQKTTGRG
jgi:hypothetical protein